MSVVAVVGVGAVGGAVTARLCAAGRDDVVLCVRTPFEALVVESPEGILRVTPRLFTTPDAVHPVPWVLLATKAHQTAGAADWLRALATSQTTVAILQNGVEHEERVAPHANGATLLPVVVECPAVRVTPGRIVQRAPAHLMVPATEAGWHFTQLFAGTDVRVTVTTDFVTAAWRKLCLNVAGGAITALTDRPLGVMRRPDVAQVARDLIRECLTVGRAEGAELDEGLVEEIVTSMVLAPAEAGTSMLTDRRAASPGAWTNDRSAGRQGCGSGHIMLRKLRWRVTVARYSRVSPVKLLSGCAWRAPRNRLMLIHTCDQYSWDDLWLDYREAVIVMTLIPIGQFRRQSIAGRVWLALI